MSDIKHSKRARKFTPAERKRKIQKAEYCLFVLGLTQKETAGIIDVSQNHLGNWVRDMGWRGKLKGSNRIEYAEKLKYKDSLSGFMAYLQKKHPRKYANMQAVYKTFISTH